MRKIFSILSALVLILSSANVFAQKKTQIDDYNLRKAYEVFAEENDYQKAIDLIDRHLRTYPSDPKGYFLRGRINSTVGEPGKAIADFNNTLKYNKPKNSGISNALIRWWKGTAYHNQRMYKEEADELATAYSLAQKEDKENLQGISFAYGRALQLIGRDSEAEKIYEAMLLRDETDVEAMAGLASVKIRNEEYSDAITFLDRAERMKPDYSSIYQLRMSAYDHLGDYVKAIDDAVIYSEKNDDDVVDDILPILKKRATYAEASIKDMVKKSEDPSYWQYILAVFYEEFYRYGDAIKAYDKLEKEYGASSSINYRRGKCYTKLGLYDAAIEEYNISMEDDPALADYIGRGDCYRLMGEFDKAIEDFTMAIEESPKLAFGYYRRGWCYEFLGDRKKAMEDYNTGIDLDDDYPYLYLMRGELLLLEGKDSEAKKDFEAILQRDTLAERGSCRQSALHFLGRDDEAVEWMEKMISADPDDAGLYYDKACLYSRMGRLDESLSALRTSFEKGYRSFNHIELDDDMDAVRSNPGYKTLMDEYKAIHQKEVEAFLESKESLKKDVNYTSSPQYAEIPMKKQYGGTYELSCTINGLPLQMTFDTGASNVSISSLEASFMLKNGYLSEKDIKGKDYYVMADGQVSEGTRVNLRELKIGETVLRNIEASVSKNQKAPLLLGQSALEKFGKITIDNENSILIITR